jgi:hypothetical protein
MRFAEPENAPVARDTDRDRVGTAGVPAAGRASESWVRVSRANMARGSGSAGVRVPGHGAEPHHHFLKYAEGVSVCRHAPRPPVLDSTSTEVHTGRTAISPAETTVAEGTA